MRQLGAVLLLLVSFMAPAMACMGPAMACKARGAQMTAEARDCCPKASDDCRQMQMPASYGCCNQGSTPPGSAALKTDTQTLRPLLALEVRHASLELLPRQDAAIGWLRGPEHAPPKPLPDIVSAFRV